MALTSPNSNIYFAQQDLIGKVQTTGDVFFVSSTAGDSSDSDGRDGRSQRRPFATVDFAKEAATANQGDVIFLMPGHAETLATATAWDMDKAGISVVGLGAGALRPTFTLTATASNVGITAANCLIENCIFTCGTADHTTTMTISADETTIRNCKFLNITGFQQISQILVGLANNDADNTLIEGCRFEAVAVGTTQAIHLAQVQDGVVIDNCSAQGEFLVACIVNPTSEILTDLTIKNCILDNLDADQLCIELLSACTGQLINNVMTGGIAGAVGLVNAGSCTNTQCFVHDKEADRTSILSHNVVA